MDWTKNLPVSRKFTVAFGIVCGLCVVLGIFTFFTFHNIATKSVDASDKSFPSVLALADIRSAMNVLRRQDLDLLLCQTQNIRSAVASDLNDFHGLFGL